MSEYNCGLVFKWLKSENCSSKESKRLAKKTREALHLTAREYRKMLSYGREKTRILERLMSLNQWDKIDFSKIPSRAGIIYKQAFARRDIIKAKYEKFAKDENTKVNAAALYPYEVVEKALKVGRYNATDRAMVNKYWANLPDWLKDADFNALCVCDTSGSMSGTPINVAISLSLYCAERAKGPFANHYISFASRPQLIKCEGVDFVDKVERIYRTNLIDNTNIEAVFDLLLDTAKRNRCSQEDLPQRILIISDMEVDAARGIGRNYNYNTGRWEFHENVPMETLMESIRRKWAAAGYQLPSLVYWNVNARNNTILDDNSDVSYISGFSPSIFKNLITGKTNYDLMLEVLDSERYAVIH